MTELNDRTSATPLPAGDERWFDEAREVTELGASEVGRSDVAVAEVGVSEVGMADVGPARVGGGSERRDVADDSVGALTSVAARPSPSGDGTVRRTHRPRSSVLGLVREYTGLIVGALIIATLIRTFLGLAFYIPSGSMIPTLEIGDRVVVSRLSYAWGEPKRGQVVVFENPTYEGDDGVFLVRWGRHLLGTVGVAQPRDKYFIKRVIGLPGEKISFVEGKVHIDGAVLAEPWLEPGVVSDALGETSFDIPAGHVFMMGDNRTNSTDGRVFGPVSEGRIVGRAVVKVWPPGRWGSL